MDLSTALATDIDEKLADSLIRLVEKCSYGQAGAKIAAANPLCEISLTA